MSKLKPKNRAAAPLMVLIVKFVCHKKGRSKQKEITLLIMPLTTN